MLNAIRRFVSDLGQAPATPFDPIDDRLAAAAILYHVVASDGFVSEEECAALRTVLGAEYGLSDKETDRLITEAKAADLEAIDLYKFTTILKARLEDDGRRRVIGMMWRMVFADGRVDEFEDNVVWRVAELLGVSARDRVLLKKAVQAESQG